MENIDPNSVDLRDPRWRVAPLGWFSDEEEPVEPEKKKFKHTEGVQWFHCVSEGELDSFVVTKPSVNTEYSMKWAVKNFSDWMEQRNACSQQTSSKLVPRSLLKNGLADELNYWLSLYLVETCNKKGERYSLKTLYQLLTGLHRHALAVNPHTPNYLDKNNRDF